MIDYLQIENFKSLRKVSLLLGGLSLFFGMNGMGKSSVLQALLLLRQSYWWGGARNLEKLRINAGLVRLGSVSDILCQNADEEEILGRMGHIDDAVDMSRDIFFNELSIPAECDLSYSEVVSLRGRYLALRSIPAQDYACSPCSM